MLSGLMVLIVEDDPLIAMLISDEVVEADGLVAGPFATVAEALCHLDGCSIAAAIVDANLADRDVTPLALRLREAMVPFIVYSGTGLPAGLQDHASDIPLVMKPGRPVDRLADLIGAPLR